MGKGQKMKYKSPKKLYNAACHGLNTTEQPELCYIYFTDAELLVYGPDRYPDELYAYTVFMEDCKDIAEHFGYKEEQIFIPGIEEYWKRIKWIREHWSELEDEDGEDNEGRTEADPE